MAVNSKQKGARFERQLAGLFREYGYSDARRTAQYCGNTGEAADVVHGRWVTEPWEVVKQCSVCGKLPNAIPGSRNEPCYSPYCPNCGAKMDGERKDNE